MKIKIVYIIIGVIMSFTVVLMVSMSLFYSNNVPPTLPSITASPDWGQFPEGPATAYVTKAIFQSFERGFMLWRQDKNCAYAVETANEQAVLPFPVHRYGYCLSVAPLPDKTVPITPPSGFSQPIGALGKVWRYYVELQAHLGFAVQLEQPYTATIPVDTGIKFTMDGSPFNRDQITLPDGHVLSCGTRSATQGSCHTNVS